MNDRYRREKINFSFKQTVSQVLLALAVNDTFRAFHSFLPETGKIKDPVMETLTNLSKDS